MDKYEVDCLIIGGGVAGLAAAKFLSQEFNKTYLIERNNFLGMETSSRNSEVIHAGIYYKKNSLKSELCLKGKHMLYEYLTEKNIDFNNCGKYIVATNQEESDSLEAIRLNAVECGLEDLTYEPNLKKLYPFLNVKNSIFSPSSGIFDSHEYFKALEKDFCDNKGTVLLGNECMEIEEAKDCFEVKIKDLNNDLIYILQTKYLINAAGIFSAEIAKLIDKTRQLDIQYIKGEYYSYSGKEQINHLIYPVPGKLSLGLHATLDLGRGIKFGPSAVETKKLDYKVEEENKMDFVKSLQHYWPSIQVNNLSPDYSGIRAKVRGAEDFNIEKLDSKNKIAINIIGYISPGLTSSLALGEKIADLVKS
ncbi:MAG: NAD(P)/FAD-dependent oxidoreductase [Gammaproteobacteria bacterium]